MKLQTMLLLIAAAWLAAMPSRGFSQEGPRWPVQVASLWDGSGVNQMGVNPILACPAEDLTCDDGCCGNCRGCCGQMEIWGSAEALMWWAKGSHLPALATTNPQGTPQIVAGRLDEASTTVLFGDQLGATQAQFGGRLTLGIWLDPEHNVGACGRFFGTQGDSEDYLAASTGDPIVARPFFNALLGQEDALLIAFPGVAEGFIDARYEMRNFFGGEALLDIMLAREARRRVDLLLGYQFLRLDDGLVVNSFHTVTEVLGPLPQGTTFSLSDQFSAQNEFHGGVIGLKGRMARGSWSFDGLIKASFGSALQRVEIAGTGEINIPPGPAAPLNGGFLALPSNIGVYERNRFVSIPEATVNLTYHHTPNLSFHIGYNLIWLSEAVTSGENVDPALNLTQQAGPLVGPAAPLFTFRTQDYWVQGMNVGLNFDF